MFNIFKKIYNKVQKDFIVINENELSILFHGYDVRLYYIENKDLRPLKAIPKNGFMTNELVVADIITNRHFQYVFSRWYKGREYFGGMINLQYVSIYSRERLSKLFNQELDEEDLVITFKNQ